MKKRHILSVLIFNFSLLLLHAIPGTSSYINDISGEYVYYKDNSFTRESYIGILFYDESTYQIRYYAPKDDNSFLPEKEMAILITVNPKSEHWEMTGEKIITTVLPTPEDTDLVNYLHDILYDFSAKRSCVELGNKEYVLNTDYPQFGGNVNITFDSIIPIFNVKKITSDEESKELECCTIGRLLSSSDNSFSNFKGYPKTETYKLNSVKVKKASQQKIQFENHSITLDENWTKAMENFWLYGDDAYISLTTIPNYSQDLELNRTFLIRRLLESTSETYNNFTNTIITTDKTGMDIILQFDSFQPNQNKVISNYGILTHKSDNTYDSFVLVAYKKAYCEKQAFFNKIIKSYKSN